MFYKLTFVYLTLLILLCVNLWRNYAGEVEAEIKLDTLAVDSVNQGMSGYFKQRMAETALYSASPLLSKTNIGRAQGYLSEELKRLHNVYQDLIFTTSEGELYWASEYGPNFPRPSPDRIKIDNYLLSYWQKIRTDSIRTQSIKLLPPSMSNPQVLVTATGERNTMLAGLISWSQVSAQTVQWGLPLIKKGAKVYLISDSVAYRLANLESFHLKPVVLESLISSFSSEQSKGEEKEINQQAYRVYLSPFKQGNFSLLVLVPQIPIYSLLGESTVWLGLFAFIGIYGLYRHKKGVVRETVKQRLLVSEQRQDKDRLLQTLLEHAPLLVWSANKDGQLTLLEGSFIHNFFQDDKPATSRKLSELLGNSEEVKRAMESNLEGRISRFQLEKNGRSLQVYQEPIYSEKKGYQGCFGAGFDISELKDFERKLTYQAYHDNLTGLANRRMLQDRLQQGVFRAERASHRLALLYIDLDGFKAVNDSYGHQVGDELLVEVARRLGSEVRHADSIARVGGDEFNIIEEEMGDSQLDHVAQRLLRALSSPFKLKGEELHITGSIGIAIYPDDALSVTEIIRCADAAMYRAKQDENNKICYFSSDLYRKSRFNRELESQMQDGIKNHEFELYYQPIVNGKTAAICGCEALLRWRHKTRGLLLPDEFMRLAEECGLINEIGLSLIADAAQQMQTWLALGCDIQFVSINIGSAQLADSRLIDEMERLLKSHTVTTKQLELEISETALVNSNQVSLKAIHKLEHFGVRLSIDDFGTGYTSLKYVQDLPIKKIKIDKSFVSGIPNNKQSVAITKAIVAMADSLGIDIVAEGVENQEQACFLLSVGVKMLQGYFYAAPLEKQALTDLALAKKRLDISKG